MYRKIRVIDLLPEKNGYYYTDGGYMMFKDGIFGYQLSNGQFNKYNVKEWFKLIDAP